MSKVVELIERQTLENVLDLVVCKNSKCHLAPQQWCYGLVLTSSKRGLVEGGREARRVCLVWGGRGANAGSAAWDGGTRSAPGVKK
jgi:hypothetical protein